ncbi:transposase [Streptomyces sp. NPDC052101]|uniref:transposase n=1 Tax=Streptomyces sp. NPDC052101 TaxID=3155763 RepID=UPI00342DC5BC
MRHGRRGCALAPHPVLDAIEGPALRPKRTRIIGLYTHPPEGATVICADEPGPVIPRTFPPAPAWSPDGHRIKAELDYTRGPEKTWVYGGLRPCDGQAVTMTASSRNSVFHQQFLQLLENANPDGDIWIVTDNLSSHNSVSTRTWLEDHPRIHHAIIPVGPCGTTCKRGPERGQGDLAALVRHEQAKARETRVKRPPVAPPAPRMPEQPYATGSALIVEHDAACLKYDGRNYRLTMRRLLRNTGTEPVTRYLIRISVDRYPGAPERSNAHYRADPLTWEELALTATCRGENMRWQAKHDRDAFKEVWLLFDNEHGRFPLYPGESVWIEYTYTVSDDKWGNWFQRAVRLPTEQLEVQLVFPADLDPVVWGTETSMAAEASPLRTPPVRSDEAGLRHFTWITTTPALHARYRLEWRFRARPEPEPDQGSSGD